jgi:ATP-dependent Lon protease
LGQGDGVMADGDDLRRRSGEVKLSKEAAEKVEKEIKRLEAMTPLSPEASVVRTYVEWLLDVPWKEKTRDRNDLGAAWDILESEHFGLKKVKERILEHLAVKILNKAIRGPILCFVGPPGVGKTSLGRSVANALGRKFVRVSLGGVRDEAEIRGHRRTYIGAMPGRIIQLMKKVGTRNPVFLLDEIDKMSADFRGDPSSALLEALDPEQNKNFNDHYLEVDYDLSGVFFITTANSTDAIPAPLLDRMEVIRLPGYTDEEKQEIAKRFLVPKQRVEHGLGEKQIQFPDETIMRLIREYTRESGVRNLERELGSLCRKTARRIVEKKNAASRAKKTAKGAKARISEKEKIFRLKADSLEKYLGAPRYTPDLPESRAGVGVATGLAWTSVGGVLLPVEVALFDGKGTVILTGKLGDVMKESAQAAISWLRSRASSLGIPANFYEKKDMHIHFPEAAVPKDGPSAGITMALALASALSGRKVRHDVAMTGEITLRGRILPVGGVKEKMLAARRGGIPKLILPKGNEKDVIEFEAESPLGLEISYVENMDEVVRKGLLPVVKKKAGSVTKAASKSRRAVKAVGVTPKRRPPATSGKKRSGSVARRTGQSGR